MSVALRPILRPVRRALQGHHTVAEALRPATLRIPFGDSRQASGGGAEKEKSNSEFGIHGRSSLLRGGSMAQCHLRSVCLVAVASPIAIPSAP
jgi:hypothetical protein